MADIKQSIKFTASQKALIHAKLKDTNFQPKDWNEDDLSELRKAIREFYRNQQHGICSYCRNPVSLTSVLNCHVEHIAPKSKYRDFIFEPKNLCVICADCNQIKREQETIGEVPDTIGDGKSRKKYPHSSSAFKIIHPHFDDYDDHIEIFGKHYYVDKSEKGGHTIIYCRLNRRIHEFGYVRECLEHESILELSGKLMKESNISKQRQIIREMAKLLLIGT